jgi:hypothetical protein
MAKVKDRPIGENSPKSGHPGSTSTCLEENVFFLADSTGLKNRMVQPRPCHAHATSNRRRNRSLTRFGQNTHVKQTTCVWA